MEEAKLEAYARYRTQVSGEIIVPSLRMGLVLVCALVTSFLVLDWLAFPHVFSEMVVARGALCLAMVACWFAAPRFPEATMLAACLGNGFGLIAVIGIAGGVTSTYYPGIMLLFLGMPVVIPLTTKQAAWMVGILFASFASLPLVTGPVDPTGYLMALFFPGASALECVASCALLDRMRFQDFLRSEEIRRARDELAELDDAKNRFTANVHHELRTPLTLMLAPLESLRSGDYGELGEDLQKILRTMHVNGRRLLKLINNLLDLAKLESNQFSVRRRPLDLRTVVEDVAEGSRPMAERKGIDLRLELGEEDLQFFADADALEKVLINLVGNALKFTESGGTITLSAGRNEGGLSIAVADTGVGLAPDQLARIFDRFAQVDGSATRKHEGTGIGLSLARELVELHEGRIWAESDGPGHGATMRVWLPVGQMDEALAEDVLEDDSGRAQKLTESMRAVESELGLGSSSGVEEGPNGGGGDRLIELEHSVDRWSGRGEAVAGDEAPEHPSDRPQVVVADDNPDLRELLAFLLGREFEVRSAADGRGALELVRERIPELVVTDIMMPEMSGTELCDAIKSDPALRNVPVMLVSSKAESEMKIHGLELGADDYVTKPFHPRELTARARSLVERRLLQLEVGRRNEELQKALSELREAEVHLVQAEKLAAVGELAAGIAHEVNNPVNFALNSARALRSAVTEVTEEARALLERGETDSAADPSQGDGAERLSREDLEDLAESMPELLGIVTEGLERTQRLVGDLKDFAAPGRRRTADWDVRKSIDATLSLLGYELGNRNVEVSLRCEGTPPRMRADASALNQVFLNLIKNAAEAMEGAGGHISLDVDWDHEFLRIAVADDGPGIPEDARDMLFQPFFTTKEAGRGTGLGLSMSRQIVQAHGGRLTFESRLGEGTTFRMELPLHFTDEEALVAEATRPSSGEEH